MIQGGIADGTSSFFGGKVAKALSHDRSRIFVSKLASLTLLSAFFCITAFRDSDFGPYLLIYAVFDQHKFFEH